MAVAKATFILRSPSIRARAVAQIMAAKEDSVVTVGDPQRTIPQNAKLHAMITDVMEQKTHCGLSLTLKDWKRLFTAGWRNELRLIPNLAGDGMIQVGDRTSDLSESEAAEVIEFIYAWGAENGVVWSEPKAKAA